MPVLGKMDEFQKKVQTIFDNPLPALVLEFVVVCCCVLLSGGMVDV